MYPATLLVPFVLCVILTIAYRPWYIGRWTSVDRWAIAALACVVLQLVPLPPRVVDVLSPHARAVWGRLSLAIPAAIPLSIDLRSGAWAAFMAAAAIVVFLTSRLLFETGGVRIVIRGIAGMGLILSAIALAQDATAHGLMYWHWHPLEEGAPPFGPFVDRNHFATWVLLAAPLTAGYLAAHSAAHHHSGASANWRQRLIALLDGRAIWLTAAIALMTVALVATLSRSGLVGLGVALVAGAVARARRRAAGRSVSIGTWLAAGIGAAIVLGLARIDPAAFTHRLAAAGSSAADRLVIWRDTLPLIRDFWLTGTGAGTYETAMLVYQRAAVGARFNQAHNQYLQLAAEGGLLLSIPTVIALLHYARTAGAALADRSGMYWVRAGACCGLAAVAAQSVFETGLTTPANTLLAAACAAVVIHEPGTHGHS